MTPSRAWKWSWIVLVPVVAHAATRGRIMGPALGLNEEDATRFRGRWVGRGHTTRTAGSAQRSGA